MRTLPPTFVCLSLLAIFGVLCGVGGVGCKVQSTRSPLDERHEHEHCHGTSGDDCHTHRHGPGHHP